jgi:hypothetical protein
VTAAGVRGARATAASVRGAVLGVLALGCASAVLPPPRPAFVADRPGAVIPGDLDVALRLDLSVARRLFGPGFLGALEIDLVDREKDAQTARLLEQALGHADAAWIAFRPGLAPRATDNVLVLRGDFGDLEPHAAGSDWAAPEDLGAAMRLYARHAPERRSAPARIYARGDDWLVFVSTAEIDAAERSIERHAADEHVDPPDQGVLSVAARVHALIPLLRPNYPVVAEALEEAQSLEGSANADDRGLEAELSARFTSEADAGRARDRIKLLFSVLSHAEGPIAALAKGAETSAVGASLVVRVRLDPKALASLLGTEGKGAS